MDDIPLFGDATRLPASLARTASGGYWSHSRPNVTIWHGNAPLNMRVKLGVFYWLRRAILHHLFLSVFAEGHSGVALHLLY